MTFALSLGSMSDAPADHVHGGCWWLRYDSHVKPQDLEDAALKLSPELRAQLAARLLESLEELSESEHDAAWALEAVRRDAEFEGNPQLGRDATEVLREARERLG